MGTHKTNFRNMKNVGCQVSRYLGDKVWNQLRSQLLNKVKKQVDEEIYNKVQDEVINQIWNRVYFRVKENMNL